MDADYQKTQASDGASKPVSDGQVSTEDVLRVAELAQLELTPEEQAGMLRDLNSILGHVAQLNQLDTTDVPAMTQVGEILPETSEGREKAPGSSLRDDEMRLSLDRQVVMTSAPETDGVYFKVPKVIER